MNQLVYSVLGRQLSSSDWLRVHGDTIMKVLYDLRTNPFNPQDLPVQENALRFATGLDLPHLRLVIERLLADTFIEEIEPSMFRITDLGATFVSTMPAYGPQAGSFGSGSLG